MSVESVMSAAWSAGIGSGVSGPASAGVWTLAQEVRIYSQTLAQNIEAFQAESEQVSAQLEGMYAVKWVSDAAAQFRDSLDTSNEEQHDTQRSLADAAAKTRIGGEALAQELETLAANIASAGAAVDQGLRSLEGATDHLSDILTNPLVSSAQAHLESLIHSPLISSVQNTLTAGAR